MSRVARLLVPALRWDDATGFSHERDTIEFGLAAGVGGFLIFGGDAAAVRELTTELHHRASAPLLIASDVERGAGQQFRGATPLPPHAALGALDDLAVTGQAGALTARECLALGVNWLLAPVADLDLEPRNPIVGSRAFGEEPVRAARHVAAWIEGARAEGALCCAKHVPGHGRTRGDSHAELPRVSASRDTMQADLATFRAAIAADVGALMTAHVVFDAFDAGTAATLSAAVLRGLVRRELGFEGLIVSDALRMQGVLDAAGGSEAQAAVTALTAGCDLLLYPSEPRVIADALERALGAELDEAAVEAAHRRIDAAVAAIRRPAALPWGAPEDGAWADEVALRAVRPHGGTPRGHPVLDLLTIDDDLGGPHPAPPRTAFAEELARLGIDCQAVVAPTRDTPLIIAVYSDIRAWKPAPGISAAAAESVRAAVAESRDAVVVFFGHGRLAGQVPAQHVLTAWGGEPIMQRAAARWLALHR